MLDSLKMIFQRLLDATVTTHFRSLYQEFNLKNRLTGLVGPRGVGKTTLLIQYIKNNFPTLANVFYFSADHIYFKDKTLYEFVETLFLKESIHTFFIDEIHKYLNWSQELKNLYDGFPHITIVFSGSSSLDLIKGSYDLSRRAKMYHLPGLSFREYLNFQCAASFERYDLKDLMSDPQQFNSHLSNFSGMLGHFHQYLKQGFYPFVQENAGSYYEKLLAIIEKTIYEDITNYYNLKTANLIYLSKILNYLASIPPGNISTYNVGKNLGIDDKTAASYLLMLKETGLVEIIYAVATGNQVLRKPEKVFLDNTNLHYALQSDSAKPTDLGTVRELAFVQSTVNAGLLVFHHKTADYQIGQYVYEIGGKNKTRQQLQGIKDAFLVKDDIVVASSGVIPLFYFGFLY